MRHLALIAPLVLAAAAAARGPGFWTVGFAPGTDRSSVAGLSSDGSLAVGTSYGDFPFNPGFTWTVAGGRYDFGLERGMPVTTEALGISDIGVVVGRTTPGSSKLSRPYLWPGSGPIQDLGLLPNHSRGYAAGVSGDGQIVVGDCEYSEFTDAYGQAFRWDAQGGMQGLGFLRPNGTHSKAYGISRDGSTIVGMSQSGGLLGDIEAYAWTQAGGMKELPGLPGQSTIENFAMAVNADGSVIVGKGNGPDNYRHAVRWVDGVVEDLSPGFDHSAQALAVSGDGDIVGGRYSVNGQNFDNAFVWTPSTGIVDLEKFLTDNGVDVPGDYQLSEVYAVSGDGLTFGGLCRNLVTGQKEGFVATVPSPATVMVLLTPGFFRRRRP